VNTGTPARYMANAAPLLAECRPICSGENPSVFLPMAAAANHNRFSNFVPEKLMYFPLVMRNVLTGVSGVVVW